jgi:O-antigen ligase
VLWIVKMVMERRWLWMRTPVDVPILLFTLMAALSLLKAVDFRYSLDEYTGEWLMGILVFYLVANTFRAQYLKSFWSVILCGNILMVGYGIYEFFLREGALVAYQVRAQSLHYGFGAFSTYLVTVLPYLFLGLRMMGKGHPVRWGGWMIFLANLFVLYLTQSRGAWIAAVLFLVWAGWMYLPRKSMLAFGALGLVLFLLFFPKEVIQHHAPINRPGAAESKIETGAARWELMRFSLERIREAPFQMLGFGQRSFVKAFPEFYNQYKGALLWQAHNTFLNITFQTGLQGLVIFIFLVYRLLKYNYRGAREEKSPWGKVYLQATFMMIVIFFVRNLTDDFFKDDTALLFWFLAGVAISIKEG